MKQQPAINAPASVLVALAVLAGVHAVRNVLPGETERWLTALLAFVPDRYNPASQNIWPGDPIAYVSSFLTYALVHEDFFHLAINSAWLLIFGTVVARRLGGAGFLVFSFLASICGAIAFLAVHRDEITLLIGASAATSGLFAAGLIVIFTGLNYGVPTAFGALPRGVPLQPLETLFRDQKFLLVMGVVVAFDLISALGGRIAGEAHIGGFVFGVLAFHPFDRAWRQRILRQRP